MKEYTSFPSCGAGSIHVCRWTPAGKPKGVVQLVHGIAEHIERYDAFAKYLNTLGFVVVAEDHMGHGGSVGENGTKGYFHGGWFAAVEDTYRLLKDTQAEFPGLPYVIFGHSMGSFMTRTLLQKHPDSGIRAAVICGTGWQPGALLAVAIPLCKTVAFFQGEKNASKFLDKLIFGAYNKKIEAPRTSHDWLTTREDIVDAYEADPLCGFFPSTGLARDMLIGIRYIQKKKNLAAMEKALPVLFVAGAEDPVGNYGPGVEQAAQAFREAGMEDVTCKLYPGCRHEILNEAGAQEIFQEIGDWILTKSK